MSRLDKPPPSRYRVEEKDGRLIVHDLYSGTKLGNQFARQPQTRPNLASGTAAPRPAADPQRNRSALNAAPKPKSANLLSALLTVNEATPRLGGRSDPGADQERAKRGAIVGIGVVLGVLFLILTSLWPFVIVALIIAPLRQALLDRALPAIKLYIAEGRFS